MSDKRIAVIGSGISGLAAAWLLQRRYDVTLFEAAPRAGGHANTMDVELDGVSHPVDTGFLVFNDKTYPNLIALFSLLGVSSVASEMSFSVSLRQPDIEWAGSNAATLFGQKRNLLRPQFWRMLSDILRFNRESVADIAAGVDPQLTLHEYLARGGYSHEFSHWYLLPMAAAIWSSPKGRILDMPMSTLVGFARNHGLLQVFNRPQWRTVEGGSRQYVQRIAAQLEDLRLSCPVLEVSRNSRNGGYTLLHKHGVDSFDHLVMACHSDQALRILGDAACPQQQQALEAIRYQPNRAFVHSDAALLPRHRSLWSAWNYLAGEDDDGANAVGVSYLINRLQPLPFKSPLVVSLNPPQRPQLSRLIASFDYEHPIIDAAAVAAQRRLPALQGRNNLWFAGAWLGHGFHEDGLVSALDVCQRLGVVAPWRGGELQAA